MRMSKQVFGIGDLGAAFLPPPPAPPPPIDPSQYFKGFTGRSLLPSPVHVIAIGGAPAPAAPPAHVVIPLPGYPIAMPVTTAPPAPESPAAPAPPRVGATFSPIPIGDASPIDKGVLITGAAVVAGLGLAVYLLRRRA